MLIAAATTNTSGPMWSYSYSYDGFGNLTAKVGTGGAPTVAPQVNSATNQVSMSGDNGFDANGNWLGTGVIQANNTPQVNTCNVENQMTSNGSVDSMNNPLTYTYDPWGKRVLQDEGAAICGPYGTVYFYSVTGQLLGTSTGADSLNCSSYPRAAITNCYLGNRLLTPVDRLGTVRYNASTGQSFAYYPWGEERASGTTDSGSFMFATYWRDGYLGSSNQADQDYAQARYYNNKLGRFWSADPGASANPNDPQTWNQYRYAGDDPANKNDPSGLCDPGVPCFSITVWAVATDLFGVMGCPPMESVYDGVCVAAIIDPTGGKGLPLGGAGNGGPPPISLSNLVPPDPCAGNSMGHALSPAAYAFLGTAAKSLPFPVPGGNLLATGAIGINFARGLSLDAQAAGGSTAYANYVFGVFMAAAGFSPSATLVVAELYGAVGSTYTNPTSPLVRSVPLANLLNIMHGYSAELNGTLCSK